MTQKILRLREVISHVGLSRTTIYDYVSRGAFPAPIHLGGGKAIGWLESEVQQWIEQHAAARPQQNTERSAA